MGIFDGFRRKKHLYTPQQMQQVQDCIENNMGEIKTVLHEAASPDIHLDVLVISPTVDFNYTRLVTLGMGAYKMAAPAQVQGMGLDRAELVICLPPDWKYDSKDKRDSWPLVQLRKIARLPVWEKGWLCYGHTVSDTPNDRPYADNTALCSMLLLTDTDSRGEDMYVHPEGMGRVNFYRLMPVYKEELKLLREEKYEELTSRWIAEGIMPVVDIHRKNCGIEG